MKHSLPKAKRTSTRTKALVTGGLVALTAAGVGGAAFAAFTGTTNAAQSVASGTVSLAGIGTNAAGNRLTVGASNIAAGDTIQRAVDPHQHRHHRPGRHHPHDQRHHELAARHRRRHRSPDDHRQVLGGLDRVGDPVHLHLQRHHLVGAGQHPGDRLQPGADQPRT